jgi:hypothetical protein
MWPYGVIGKRLDRSSLGGLLLEAIVRSPWVPGDPFLFEQGGCRDAEIGRWPLGEALVPLAAIDLALKGGQRNVAERPVMPPRIAPKASVERLGQILDLEA